jgi:membrane fusion protein (multidrug efflux system)
MAENLTIPRASASAVSAALAALLAAVLLAGCDGANSQPPGGMPPPEVTVVTIEPRTIQATFEYTGQTAGYREVEVRARVSGILLKRNYDEGGRVTAGQSLFTVDPALYDAALKRAEADLGAAQARLQQWRREVARLKPLFKAKAVSQKDYDDAVSNEAIAAADVKAAQARVVEARLNLEYTRVESPIAGIAGRALRSEGNYVTGPDVLLTTVTQIDPMYVLFGISDEERLKLHRETEAGRLVLPKDGQFDVNVKLAEGGLYGKTGKMNFTGVIVSGTTGTSEARAELPNPDGLLRPGQFVRVTLSGAQRPNATLVPQRAVLEGPQGKFVYVVSAEGKAEARPVQLGDWQGDDWIVTAGLNAGDKVIVDGVMKIGPGAPVRVADPNVPKPGAAPKAAAK